MNDPRDIDDDTKKSLRGKRHVSGGWVCDCSTTGAAPWGNVKPDSQSYCERCQIYRPTGFSERGSNG